MAYYSNFKLPPLKFTDSRSSSTKLLFRGSSSRCSSKVGDDKPTCSVGPKLDLDVDLDIEPLDDDLTVSTQEVDEPSSHELERRSSVSGWQQLRSKFLSVATECAALPLGQLCILCPEAAEIRCLECSPSIYYCNSCFRKQHDKINYFHVGEKWEVWNILASVTL